MAQKQKKWLGGKLMTKKVSLVWLNTHFYVNS